MRSQYYNFCTLSIDANELSQGAVIGISAGLGVFSVSVVLFILCAVVTYFLVKRTKAKPHLKSLNKTARDLKNLHSIESNNTDSEMQNTTKSASNGQNTDPKEKLFQDKLIDLTKEINDLAKILKVDIDADEDSDPVTEENLQNFKQSMEKALAIISHKNEIKVKVDVEEAKV